MQSCLERVMHDRRSMVPLPGMPSAPSSLIIGGPVGPTPKPSILRLALALCSRCHLAHCERSLLNLLETVMLIEAFERLLRWRAAARCPLLHSCTMRTVRAVW